MAKSAEWYYEQGGESIGPISSEQLKSLAQSGQITPDTLVCRAGDQQWAAASKVRGLFPAPGMPEFTAQAPPEVVPPMRINAGAREDAAPYRSPTYQPELTSRSSGMDFTARRFPALELAARVYEILSILALVLGAIATLFALWGFLQAISAGFGVMIVQGGMVLYVLFMTVLSWIGLKAVAEFVRLSIHVQNNTHMTAENTHQMTRLMSEQFARAQ